MSALLSVLSISNDNIPNTDVPLRSKPVRPCTNSLPLCGYGNSNMSKSYPNMLNLLGCASSERIVMLLYERK